MCSKIHQDMVVPLDHPQRLTAPLRIGNPCWKDISSNNRNIRVVLKKIVEQPSTSVKRPELGLASVLKRECASQCLLVAGLRSHVDT